MRRFNIVFFMGILLSTAVMAVPGRIGGWPQNQEMRQKTATFDSYMRGSPAYSNHPQHSNYMGSFGKGAPPATGGAAMNFDASVPDLPAAAPVAAGGRIPEKGCNGEIAVGFDKDGYEVYENTNGLFGYEDDCSATVNVNEADVVEWLN